MTLFRGIRKKNSSQTQISYSQKDYTMRNVIANRKEAYLDAKSNSQEPINTSYKAREREPDYSIIQSRPHFFSASFHT